MRKTAICLLLLFAIACNRAESEAPTSSPSLARGTEHAKQVVNDAVANAAPEEGRAAGRLGSTPPAAPRLDRMIVRTAQVSMIVSDTSRTIDNVTRVVESHGGYVNDSKIWREGELLRANLTLKLPSDKLSQALAAIRGLSVRVQNESTSSEEVTQEYVDLSSQLRNLEAAEVELRALMTAVRERTKRASDILEIHGQLTSIRSQIEQTKGRMRYLEQMSSFSTIHLEMIPDAIAKPVVEPGWQPLVVAKDAGRALVNALQGIANIAIWLALYVLPIVFLFALGALILWKLGRALHARTRAV